LGWEITEFSHSKSITKLKWRMENGELRKLESRLQRNILEDHEKMPSSPEPMRHAALPESYPRKRGGMNSPGRTPNGEKCRRWLGDGLGCSATPNRGTAVLKKCEEHPKGGEE
jgi:hypothetical protein